jgi:hypothetical protein
MTQFDMHVETLALFRLLETENNDGWLDGRDLHYTSGTLSSSDLNDPQDIMLLGLNAGPKVQLVGSRKFACKVAPLGEDLPMCTEIWTRVVAVSLISTHGGRLGHLHHHYSVRSSDSGHTSSCQPRDFNDLRNAPPNLKIGCQTRLGPVPRPPDCAWQWFIRSALLSHTLATRLRSATNLHFSTTPSSPQPVKSG